MFYGADALVGEHNPHHRSGQHARFRLPDVRHREDTDDHHQREGVLQKIRDPVVAQKKNDQRRAHESNQTSRPQRLDKFLRDRLGPAVESARQDGFVDQDRQQRANRVIEDALPLDDAADLALGPDVT